MARGERYTTAAARAKEASNGVALPDGKFPIIDKHSLRSAIALIGTYDGSHAAAKAHIVTKAKDLGLSSELPSDWRNTDKSGLADAYVPAHD
jgi:hypothetical protein